MAGENPLAFSEAGADIFQKAKGQALLWVYFLADNGQAQSQQAVQKPTFALLELNPQGYVGGDGEIGHYLVQAARTTIVVRAVSRDEPVASVPCRGILAASITGTALVAGCRVKQAVYLDLQRD